MAIFLVVSQKGWLAEFRSLLLKENGNCDNPAQNVEITLIKWDFRQQQCAGKRYFSCHKSSFWKARRPMLTTPNTQLVVASWKAGELKQVLSCLSLTLPCSLCCSRVSWLLPRHYPVKSPASRPGPFPLQTGSRALTHWVCQEEVLRWLTAACIPDAGGDCFSTVQSNKKGQLRWNKLIAQTLCSGLRAQRGMATSPAESLTYVPFPQLGPPIRAAFCCHCGKGLQRNKAVTCCKTKRKTWCLIQCHPKTICLSFPNSEQDWIPKTSLFRSCPLQKHPQFPKDWVVISKI